MLRNLFPSLQRGLIPLGLAALGTWLGWLGLQGWHDWQALDTPPAQTIASIAESAPVHHPLDNRAIAELFGALSATPLEASSHAVDLTLLASLSEGRAVLSRALIQSPEGSAFYRLGDRLPGGARLKAVHPDHVVIQAGGHEQRLSFPHSRERLLAPRTAP
ncbi:type II secretion system protein N [Pseudomonas sp. D(2018)]|uniref:type II secretion system protein N n=1 Tax=Pseudomonadaceae TaxID=135621 RepID=UPI0010F51AE2|nr:type II secretion system protein N [Pseudomonas sp. D(2018)]